MSNQLDLGAILSAMEDSPLFHGLSQSAVVGANLRIDRFAAGEQLLRQGETGDCAYFIVNGIIGLFRSDLNTEPRLFRKATRGELLGEYALLTDLPRSASALALTDADVVVIDKDTFGKLVETDLVFSRRIIKDLAVSASKGRAHDLKIRPLVLVLSESTRPQSGMGSASQDMNELIATFRRCGVVTVEDHRGQSVPTEQQSSLIYRAHHLHRATLLIVDRVSDVHASLQPLVDRYVVIASENSFGAEDLDGLTRHNPSIDLIRVWPSGQARPEPMKNKPPLDGLQLHDIYNVRCGNRRDHLRTVRCIMGTGNILVLGGGGAKGFAHIGAMRALEESNIPGFDAICGVSIGAFIGSLLALEMKAVDVTRVMKRLFLEGQPYTPTFPVHSLFRYTRHIRTAESIYANLNLEDTWVPCIVGTVNINTNQSVFWHSGPLLKTVIASMSIPGLAPPVKIADSGFHVDGGVLDNLPILEARRRTTGHVVAISLDQGVGRRDLEAVSRMKGLLPRLLRLFGLVSDDLPSLTTTIMHTMLSAARLKSDTDMGYADLVLCPDLADIGLLDWKSHAEAEAQGHAAMKTCLEEGRLSHCWSAETAGVACPLPPSPQRVVI